MSRHRKPSVASSRTPMWRIASALASVIAMVAAMAVLGSSAQASTPPYQVTAGVALSPDGGLPTDGTADGAVAAAATALKLNQLVADSHVDPGTRLSYTLQVVNTSSDTTTADDVAVVDNVKDLLKYATIATAAADLEAAGLSLNKDDGTLTWTPTNPPAAGQVASTAFEVTVDDDVVGDATITTKAAASGSECTADGCATSLTVKGAPAKAQALSDGAADGAADPTTSSNATATSTSPADSTAGDSPDDTADSSSTKSTSDTSTQTSTEATTESADADPTTESPALTTSTQPTTSDVPATTTDQPAPSTTTSSADGGTTKSLIGPKALGGVTPQSEGGFRPMAVAASGPWTLTKTSDPGPGSVQAGTSITYTLTATNTARGECTDREWWGCGGYADGTAVREATATDDISALISAGATFDGDFDYSGSNAHTATYDASTHVITWSPSSIPGAHYNGYFSGWSDGHVSVSFTIDTTNVHNANSAVHLTNTATAASPGACDSSSDCTVSHTIPKQGSALQCTPGVIYAISAGGQLQEVTAGSVTDIGTDAPGDDNYNGLGIGSGGTDVYAYHRSSGTAFMYKFDTASQTWSYTGDSHDTGLDGSLVAGAVDLNTGNYYFGGYEDSGSTFKLWDYTPSSGHFTYVGKVDTSEDSGGSANGDIAFDSSGNLFIVRGSGNYTSIFSVTAQSLANASGGTISASYLTDKKTMNNVNGVAFDSNSTGYLGASSEVRSYDMPNWTYDDTVVDDDLSSTDLASCSSPATVTLQKNVVGRASGGDQFKLTLTQGSSEIGTATTTGSGTGIQAEQVGPAPAKRGVQVNFKEEPANSGTDLSRYATSYECSADGVHMAGSSGTGTSGDVSIPAGAENVTCVMKNSPLVAHVTVHKDVVDADGGNKRPGANWTVDAVAADSGPGTVTPSVSGSQDTNASGDAKWDFTFTDKGGSADLSVAETQQGGYAFLAGQCVVTHLDGNKTTASLDGSASQGIGSILPGDNVDCTYVNQVIPPATLTLKKVVDQNDTNGQATAADWMLKATGQEDGTSTISGVTGSDDITKAVVEPGTYDLTETAVAGSGDATTGYDRGTWQCINNDDSNATSGSPVTAQPGDNWVCTITNTAVKASVTVDKVWVIDGVTYTVPQGDGDSLPNGFSADLTLTGQTSAEWGQKYDGYKQGDTVTIGEKNITKPDACTVTKGGDLGGQTLKKGANTYTVTNTVTCDVSVTLSKVWENGIPGNAVNLTITGGSDATVGSSTVGGTTTAANATATRGSTVTLAEVFQSGKGSAAQYSTRLSCIVPLSDGSSNTVPVELNGGLSGNLNISNDAAPGATVACEFTNSAASSTVTLAKAWTNGIPGDAVTLTVEDTTHTATDSSGSSTAPNAGTTSSVTVYPGDEISISEAAKTTTPATDFANYTTTWSCLIGSTTVKSGTGTSGTFTVPADIDPGSTIDCTIENARKAASVTLTKAWVDPINGNGVDLTITDGSSTGTGTNTAGATAGNKDAELDVLVGDTVAIDETAQSGTNLGNYAVTYACTVGGDDVTVDANHTFTVPASAAGHAVECTITNTRGEVSVTLQKKWVNGAAGDKTEISINGKIATDDHGFAIATVDSADGDGISSEAATLTVGAGSTVDLNETLATGNIGGYDVTDFSCDNAETDWKSGTSASFTAPGSGNVTCTVTNTRTHAELTLTKAWGDNAHEGDSTTLHATGNDGVEKDATDTVGGDHDTVTVPVYSGEEVPVSESMGATNHGTYSSVLTCENNADVTSGAGPTIVSKTDTASGKIRVSKDLNGDAACTYSNTRTVATMTLVKSWANGAKDDTADLTGAGTGQSGSGSLTSTSPSDGYSGPGTDDPSTTIAIYSGDTVNLSEVLGTDNTGSYDTTLQCGSETITLTGLAGTYTVPAQPATVTCTFTNTRTAAQLTVQKKWVNGAKDDSTTLYATGNDGTKKHADSTVGDTPSFTDADHTVTVPVSSGEEVPVSETLGDNIGSYTSELSCPTASGATVEGAAGTAGTITAPKTLDGDITCTYTNTRKSVTVNLQKTWVNGFDGDTTKLTVAGSGQSDDATSTSDGTSGRWIDDAAEHTATITALSGDTVTLSEAIGADNHGYYNITGLSCTGGVGVDWETGEATGTITAPSRLDHVTCAFTNKRAQTHLTLEKAWVGAVGGDTADLAISNQEGQLSGSGTATATAPSDNGGTGTSSNTVTVDVFSGDTLTLGEELPSGNTGSYTSSITCSPADGFAADDSGQSGTLTVPKTALDSDVTCTVTNSRSSVHVTLQKSWVDGAEGDTAGLSINSGTAVEATVPDNGHSVSEATATADVPSGSSVTLGEVLPFTGNTNTGSYNVTGLECVNKAGDQVDVTQDDDDPATGTFTAPSGGDVTCTFTNTRTHANLTLVKKWINGADRDTTELTAGTASKTSTAKGTASFTDTDHEVVVPVFSGQQIDLTETLGDNTGAYTRTLTCDADGLGGTTVTDTGISGTFTMPRIATDVTCTVTNTRAKAQITLQKQWKHGAKGDTADLSLTSTGLSGPGAIDSTVATDGFSGVQDGDSDTVTVYSGDTLTLSETLGEANTGTYDTTLTCGSDTIDLTDLSAQIDAPTSSETCTFTNTRTSAKLTLNKVWDHAAEGDTATLKAVSGTDEGSGTSTATGKATQTDENVTSIDIYSGDTVDLSETLGTKDQPNSGTYTTGWVCTDDDPYTGDIGNADASSGTYYVPDNPTNTNCTFTNTRTSTTLTLVKDWDGGMKANAADLTIDGNGQTGSGTATATVPNDNYTDASSETVHVTAYSGDTADLSEILTGPNASYTSTLECTDGGILSDNTGTSGTVTIDGTPKDGITCTLTNKAVAAAWKVEKTADPATGSVVEPGQMITYTLTATHESGVSPTNVTVTDDLSDVVNHASNPADITVTPSSDDASYDAEHQTLTWNIARLDQTATVTYTVTVDADASNVVLSNHATGGTDGPCVTGCSTEHIVPKFTKTFSSAQQHMGTDGWDGTWDVTYTLSVTNPSKDLAATYDLSDSPAFPDDVTPNSGSVTSALNQPAGSTDATDITGLTNSWNDPTLTVVAGRVIPANSTDLYTVVINASAPLVGEAPQCGEGPGNGFYNAATATFGDATFDSSDCGDIPQVATPTITKKVDATTQNADGTWTVNYTISVTNPSEKWATQYDVTDELQYGAGITVADGDATVTGPGANSGWNGSDDTLVAQGEYLNKDATATYHVTVTATVSAGAWNGTDGAPAPVQCQSNEPGGFGNSSHAGLSEPEIPKLRGAAGALLDAPDDAAGQDAYACSEPVQPKIDKTFDSAKANADGGWDVAYTITVKNPADKPAGGTTGPDLTFTLSDTPSFPNGLTVTGAELTDSSIGGLVPGSYDDGTGVLTIISTPVTLGAGDSQTFEITVHTAAPEAPLPTEDLTCSASSPHAGFNNTATATSGGQEFTDDACGDIPAWTVFKKVDQQIAAVGDTLTYTLTATNTGPTDIVGATATDTLPAGVTLVTGGLDSSLTPSTDGSTLTWAIPDIASGSDPVSVTYRVTVDKSASGTTQTNLVVPDGPAGQCEDGDDANCTTNTDVPEWTLAKSADKQVADPGDTVTYTLAATNTGEIAVTGAVATDTLPADVTVASLGSGLTDNGDGTLTWNIPEMDADGGNITVSYTVTVNDDAAGTTQTNLVVPDSPGGQCVPTETPKLAALALEDTGSTVDDANCTTDTDIPAWTLAKTSDPKTGSTVETGDQISYTLTVTNSGPGVLNGATVTDDLSDVLNHATFGGFTAGSDQAKLDGNTLTWTVPDGLKANDTASITYTVTVNEDANGVTLTNVATPGTPAGTCDAEADCTTTHTVPPLDVVLSISKTASAATVAQGDTFTYSIVVSNSTKGTADPVTLTDPIPADVSVTKVTTDTTGAVTWKDCAITGADANGYGGTLDCTLSAPLTAGEAAPTIVLAAVMSPDALGPETVTNTATVTWKNPDQPKLGSQSAKDSAAVDVPIQVLPTTAEPTPPPATTKPSGNLSYTGVPAWQLGWTALLLLGIGGALLVVGATRRRRSQKH